MSVAKTHNLTFNEAKCAYFTDTIKLLGSKIHNGSLRPDPDRVKTLRELPPPKTTKEQQRVVGLSAYFAQWISHYSDKIKPLVINRVFSLKDQALSSFVNLKSELADVTLSVINEKDPLTVEIDASDVAISAILNQNNRPVAFWSRSLRRNELSQSSVEKEAMAIVETIRK